MSYADKTRNDSDQLNPIWTGLSQYRAEWSNAVNTSTAVPGLVW